MAALLSRGREVAACLACVLTLLPATPRASGPPAVAGRYTKADAEHTILEVHAAEGGYSLRLIGGAPIGLAGASPADCYIEARGQLIDGRIRARFAPFQNDVFDFDAVSAEREARYVELSFLTGKAEVTRADIIGYCAPGSQFLGGYVRAVDPPG